MKNLFGTDGIRFIYDQSLKPLILKIGQALNSFTCKEIIIGHDTRYSSEEIASFICSQLQNQKISYVSVMATPAICYLSKKHNALGIMITASHNPSDYNGIKFFFKGEKLSKKLQLKFEQEILNVSETSYSSFNLPLINDAYREEYFAFLKTHISQTPFPIAFDCANGAVSYYLKDLVNKINVDCHLIHNNPDGYNINDCCGALHPEILQAYIKKNHIPYGFSFDGDADRFVFMDQNTIYSGDDIIYLFSHYFHLKKDTVVLTCYSNPALIKLLNQEKINVKVVEVGDENVFALLKKDNLSLGGEDSGHIIIKDLLSTGDGFLNALIMIKLIRDNLHSLLRKKYIPQPYKLISFSLNNKESIDHPIVKERINTLKKIYKDLYINIRKSGTENKVRLYLSHPLLSIINYVYIRITSDIKIIDASISVDNFDNKYIDETSVFGDHVTLKGECHISQSSIGSFTIIKSSYIESSTIKANCQIGPFAHVHTNSYINEKSRIGNYVEIKNSTLGKNSKVAHLTYIGDTISLDNVNFGCGTITVNYDGKLKHKTYIGNNVFIGCNSNLIAPIEIKDNAFIAAGSTITSSLEEGDFAIARARQQIKKEGAKKYQYGGEK